MKFLEDFLKKFQDRTEIQRDLTNFCQYMVSIGLSHAEIYALLDYATQNLNLFLSMISHNYTYKEIAMYFSDKANYDIQDNKIYIDGKFVGYIDKETFEFKTDEKEGQPEN